MNRKKPALSLVNNPGACKSGLDSIWLIACHQTANRLASKNYTSQLFKMSIDQCIRRGRIKYMRHSKKPRHPLAEANSRTESALNACRSKRTLGILKGTAEHARAHVLLLSPSRVGDAQSQPHFVEWYVQILASHQSLRHRCTVSCHTVMEG